MTTNDFIECVAAGLRKMDYKPDYFVLIINQFPDWCVDTGSVLGIPAIKVSVFQNIGYAGLNYPIVPGWRDLCEEIIEEQTILFQKGYESELKEE